jgi:hypothetical protein
MSYIALCCNSPTGIDGRTAPWSGTGNRSRDGNSRAVMPLSTDDKAGVAVQRAPTRPAATAVVTSHWPTLWVTASTVSFWLRHDDGETAVFPAGDFGFQRSTRHGWRNKGSLGDSR